MNDRGNSESIDQRLEYPNLADERWKMVRSAIEHQDNLVNQRLGWLFIGHSILFVCFAMLQKDVLDKGHKLESTLAIEMGLAVLFLCAAWIAMVTNRSNTLANNHIGSLRQWWIDNGQARRAKSAVVPETSSALAAGQIGEESKLELVPSNSPPITVNAPGNRGSIPTLMALMDLVLLVVCLGISGQIYLDSKLSVSVPRAVESRSASEGNPRMDTSDQPSDLGTSLDGSDSAGGEGGGSARSLGPVNEP